MPIYLHQDFLVRMPLLDLLAKLQAWIGKMAHINDDQVIHGSGGNHRASRVLINGSFNVIASHAQHESAQMLHGGVTVNKQNAGLTSESSHDRCCQSTPAQAPAYGPIIVVPGLLFHSC